MNNQTQPDKSDNERWDQVYAQKFMTMWHPNEDIIRFCARLIQKQLSPERYELKRKVDKVLDLGCGNGRHAIYFAEQGFKASGIDVSPQAIEWANEWSKRKGLDVDFRVASISDLPFEDNAFDVVVAHGVLDHVRMELAKQATQEVARILKPNGLFYCDLRSDTDFECGVGKEVARNTFVVHEGYEEGLVQHFFSLDEIHELFDGLFEINYSEITEKRLGPDFQRKYSRWVLALEAI